MLFLGKALPAWLYAGHLESSVDAVLKRVGLKSHIRLSGSTVKIILDYVIRRLNALSAG